jgi:hypothetical protein
MVECQRRATAIAALYKVKEKLSKTTFSANNYSQLFAKES